MNTRNYTKPSDMMKNWSMSNLIEYKEVMESKYNDLLKDKNYMSDLVNDDVILELEIKRVYNLLVVVNTEILLRKLN